LGIGRRRRGRREGNNNYKKFKIKNKILPTK